ncbi:MAG: altronate dehydratase [Salinarimonadaceae bacterium]|nr:MAG: altronate dehydratase [Salinarimonadaceae bacterium]
MDAAGKVVRLHREDNVLVATAVLSPGLAIADGVIARERIDVGHKVAACAIGAGEPVRKFGQVIGFASAAIAAGGHVHSHNLAMGDFGRDYAIGSEARETVFVPPEQRATFQGYRRASGRAGTRNYIGILTTVNCSATVARHIAAHMTDSGVLDDYPDVDGVVALTHGTGCGMASSGDGFANLQRTIWGYARHPNFAGILLIGLGCEVNHIDFLLEAYGIARGPLFRVMNIQDTGGTRRTVEAGCAHIREMLPEAARARREPCPASELVVALQCGGSDGYSGMTANPALGFASDLLVAHGGAAVLAETPEIFGAEHLLTRRAASREVGEKLLERIGWWKDYVARNGGALDNNPTPGNKAGGLTTILEKSLGAAAKGGTSNLVAVCRYAEPIEARGFVFMDSPGFDPASVTGQIAGGCNIVCFTTGRGSVSGYKPAPCIKIATNTAMFARMSEDMDINCGAIVGGGESVESMGRAIFERILAVASGEHTKSEAEGFGDCEFVPWQVGAVM